MDVLASQSAIRLRCTRSRSPVDRHGPVPGSARAVCCRLDAFPCEPDLLADLLLSPGEWELWTRMRAVEKRRHEWLLGRWPPRMPCGGWWKEHSGVQLAPAEIEIRPDPYGCPRVAIR